MDLVLQAPDDVGQEGRECKSISGRYESLAIIGEGNYGQVLLARETFGRRNLVAVKVPALHAAMQGEDQGIHMILLREIWLLQSIEHENVIELKEVCCEDGDLYLVFPFMPHNLDGYLQKRQNPLSLPEVKCVMHGFLSGLVALHRRRILHRDIKTSNLLLSESGVVKIADLGLAKAIEGDEAKLTPTVVTLWFRPPELLLGADRYSEAVDVWSAACVFMKLLTGEHCMTGRSLVDQIHLTFNLMGRPITNSADVGGDLNTQRRYWPGLTKLSGYPDVRWEVFDAKGELEGLLHKKGAPWSAVDLVCRMFALDPDTRISAEDALEHFFFEEGPPPCAPEELAPIRSSHDLVMQHADKRASNTRNNRTGGR